MQTTSVIPFLVGLLVLSFNKCCGRFVFPPHHQIPFPAPVGYFDEGGYDKFAKVDASFYMTNILQPSVRFSSFSESESGWRRQSCLDCVSINGSNTECESPSAISLISLKTCSTTDSIPYCTVEYGVLADNRTYVKRSCNTKLCQTCASSSFFPSKCYPFQCDSCNWDKCNSGDIQKVFSHNWHGCIPDRSEPSNTFDKAKPCVKADFTEKIVLVIIVMLVVAFCWVCACCMHRNWNRYRSY